MSGQDNTPQKPPYDATSGLSMEQQFKLHVLTQEVQMMSREQAQQYLVEVLRQMMVKDNVVKKLVGVEMDSWPKAG